MCAAHKRRVKRVATYNGFHNIGEEDAKVKIEREFILVLKMENSNIYAVFTNGSLILQLCGTSITHRNMC